jgi:hypothetical protein
MPLDWVNRTKPAYIEDIDTLRFPIPLPADFLEPFVKVKGGNRMVSNFSYNSVQTHSTNLDGKITEVTESTRIKNGKGTKTVKKRAGRKVSSKTLPLTSAEVKNIETRKFMPSLFADCHALAKPMQSAPIHRSCHGHCNNQLVEVSRRRFSKKMRKVKGRTKKHSK